MGINDLDNAEEVLRHFQELQAHGKGPLPSERDPRTMPGFQPSPFDVRRRVSCGKTFQLGVDPGGGQKFRDNVKASSEFISEWAVKILIPSEMVTKIAAAEIDYDLKCKLMVRQDGDQFTEYQPAFNLNYENLDIPLVGQCLGVHGREIDLVMERPTAGGGLLIVQAAIVQGRPSLSFVNRKLTVVGGAGAASVSIPVFATRFSVFGTADVGDVLTQRDPGNIAVQTVTVPAGGFCCLLPIHPDAAFIGYTSANNKEIAVGFEVNS